MNDLSTELDSRYEEIKELIDHLCKEEFASIGYSLINPTLKATLFLLYYNLIESIIYSIFERLFDKVAENCLDFNDLNSLLQIQYQKYDKDGTVAENDLIKLDLKKYSGKVTLFSGNLDARSIRKLLKDWGFKDDFHIEEESKLYDIRRVRNALAHGERAFKDVGKSLSLSDMQKYGTVTYKYLSQIVSVANLYFEEKKYLGGQI